MIGGREGVREGRKEGGRGRMAVYACLCAWLGLRVKVVGRCAYIYFVCFVGLIVRQKERTRVRCVRWVVKLVYGKGRRNNHKKRERGEGKRVGNNMPL